MAAQPFLSSPSHCPTSRRRDVLSRVAAVTAMVGVVALGMSAGRPAVAVARAGPGRATISVSADARSVPQKVRAQVETAAKRDLEILSSFYGSSELRRAQIILASSPAEFVGLAGNQPPDVLAVADESRGRIVVSPASWRGDPARLGSVLLHELSHLVLGAKFGASRTRLPRWLDEGMAQYVAGDWEFDIDWTVRHKEIIEAAASSGRLVPIADLDRLFDGDRSDVQLAYAQSYSFVSHVATSYGQRGLRLFLDAAARPGGSPEMASKDVFGADIGDLESAWRESLRSRSRWWDVLLEGSNFSVLLWSTLAVLAIVGFIVVSLRKRRAYAGMEEETARRGELPSEEN